MTPCSLREGESARICFVQATRTAAQTIPGSPCPSRTECKSDESAGEERADLLPALEAHDRYESHPQSPEIPLQRVEQDPQSRLHVVHPRRRCETHDVRELGRKDEPYGAQSETVKHLRWSRCMGRRVTTEDTAWERRE